MNSFDKELKIVEADFNNKFPINVALDDAKNILNVAAISTSFVPIVGQIMGVLSGIVGMTVTEADWQSANKRMIDDKDDIHQLRDDVKSVEERLEIANSYLKYLNKTNPNYGLYVFYIYHTMQEKISEFSRLDSIYKKYPLIASPFLMILSLAVAAFEPIARDQMPIETKEFSLPCHLYDLLFDYCAYSIDARLDKLDLSVEDRIFVKNYPYSPYGYNLTDSMDCTHNAGSSDCVNDEFGTKYCNSNYPCRLGYAFYIRHQIEKISPVDQLGQACRKEWPYRRASGKFIRY